MVKEYLWEQADGSHLKVIVDRKKGTVVAKDKHGNVKIDEKGLGEEQIDLIEKQFLEVVTNFPEKSNKHSRHFDPMFW